MIFIQTNLYATDEPPQISTIWKALSGDWIWVSGYLSFSAAGYLTTMWLANGNNLKKSYLCHIRKISRRVLIMTCGSNLTKVINIFHPRACLIIDKKRSLLSKSQKKSELYKILISKWWELTAFSDIKITTQISKRENWSRQLRNMSEKQFQTLPLWKKNENLLDVPSRRVSVVAVSTIKTLQIHATEVIYVYLFLGQLLLPQEWKNPSCNVNYSNFCGAIDNRKSQHNSFWVFFYIFPSCKRLSFIPVSDPSLCYPFGLLI